MSKETEEQLRITNENPELSVEAWLLAILEEHDGLCLDNEAERATLAAVLATALISPKPPHQTTGSSVFPLPFE
jgi:hypothetical protein